MMRTGARLCCLLGIGWASVALALTPAEQKEYRDKFLEITPKVDSFNQWIERTNGLPPDFDALPKQNNLPDPFKFLDGRPVNMPADWQARRAEIRQLFEKYVIGTMPPKPKLDQIVPVSAEQAAAEAAARGAGRGFPGGARRGGPASGPATAAADGTPTTAPGGRAGLARGPRGAAAAPGGRAGRGPVAGAVTRIVDLKYGPDSAITTRVTLTLPPGNGPFPVFIGGGPEATNNGYISCSFPSSVDAPPNIGQYYPEYDWGSMAKIAWTTQMVVDYLYTVPEVDKRYIAITGYSRGGKMAVLTAALEERITACVAGSTGVGGALAWRYGSEKNVAEGIETTTRPYAIWYKTAFRFFSGREDRLPVDGNLLVDLIAPRSVLILYGINDEVNSTWGNEQTYYDSLKVYKSLGRPDAVSILRIDGVGKHHGANDLPATMKWLDIQFGKSNEKWANNLMFPWDYSKWKQTSGDATDVGKLAQHAANAPLTGTASEQEWGRKVEQVRASVTSMLGTAPDKSVLEQNPVTNPGDPGIDDTPRWVIGRPTVIEHGWTATGKAAGIASRDIRFGPGKIRGDFYYKEGTAPDAKLPTVIFLHGNSYPLGYMWVYRWDPHPILALANAGYAVLAFDQTSFGSRMNEAASFYDKYPKWSQMGRMVQDARDAVAAVRADPMCDPDKVFVFGYGLGGSVAIYSAAMDSNIKGVVSICGFTPMRTDTSDKGTGGIARWSHERGLIPQLGAFVGQESRIPYDYDELIASIAPRPTYIFAPLMDRDATPADVRGAVDRAGSAFSLFNAKSKLVLDEPWDYFRLSLPAQDRIVKWMTENMK